MTPFATQLLSGTAVGYGQLQAKMRWNLHAYLL